MAYPYRVWLTEEQRAELRGLVGGGVAPARMLTRARVLLKADHGEGGPGWSDAAIAGALDVNPSTVLRVRRRFATDGLAATLERKRPDRRPRVPAPAGRGGRGAAGRPGLRRAAGGPGAVVPAPARGRVGAPGGRGRRLPRDGAPDPQKNELKPWLKEQWCLAPAADPDFVWHMADVLAVYERPPDPARPVVCLDETSRRLLADARPPEPPAPGRPARQDPEYVRGGVANLFLATEPLAGRRHVLVSDQRTRLAFAACGKDLVEVRYPGAERIVLGLDQLTTHSPASLYAAFPPAEAARLAAKLEIHHTPKHGSWLNMAEIELSILERQCLRRRIPDRPTLERAVAAWAARRNAAAAAIDWQFTTADARTKLRRLYPAIEP
jgi:DDE superfamily endonuclease/Homeodomain-like domain